MKLYKGKINLCNVLVSVSCVVSGIGKSLHQACISIGIGINLQTFIGASKTQIGDNRI